MSLKEITVSNRLQQFVNCLFVSDRCPHNLPQECLLYRWNKSLILQLSFFNILTHFTANQSCERIHNKRCQVSQVLLFKSRQENWHRDRHIRVGRDKCKHAYNELNKTIIVKPKLLANLGWKIDSKPSVNPREPGNPPFFWLCCHTTPLPHMHKMTTLAGSPKCTSVSHMCPVLSCPMKLSGACYARYTDRPLGS